MSAAVAFVGYSHSMVFCVVAEVSLLLLMAAVYIVFDGGYLLSLVTDVGFRRRFR
jgi:hypothetical protein